MEWSVERIYNRPTRKEAYTAPELGDYRHTQIELFSATRGCLLIITSRRPWIDIMLLTLGVGFP